MFVNKYLAYYFLGTAAYGTIRKVAQVWNANTKSYRWDDKPKPMLLGDKIGIVCASAVMSPYLLPFLIKDDINYIDVKLRGLDPNDYFDDDQLTTIDYLFR